MKSVISAVLMIAMPMVAQIGIRQHVEPPIDAKSAKYVLVVEAQEVDPGKSYLMICGDSRPDCNTVYRTLPKYIPLASLDDVQAYLSQEGVVFIKLFSLADVPVAVKESTTTTAQPPLVTHKKTYTIPSNPVPQRMTR